MGFVFVLGGARSGKSALAVRLGGESGLPVTFIATATAGDAEMADRIGRHRDSRPSGWTTVEAPLELAAAVDAAAPDDFLIIDCLTLWVSNLMGAGHSAGACLHMTDEVSSALMRRRGVVVSNEVGMGIVPDNELGRAFRDLLGTVNRCFAERAETAVLLVAGRTLELGRQ
jgi:adenosylcobinamide kinase/adenosylcobinamide-phosphate guanylyltransferase